MEIQWHLNQITAETELNGRGRHAHEPRTSKENGRRRLHCAKRSVTQRKLRQMTNKLAEKFEISGNTIADQLSRPFAFAGSAGRFFNLPAVSHPRLRSLDIADGDLAGASILLGVEGDLLTLVEAAHAGALERRGVDEHVLAAVVRRDKAEALLIIVELYSARVHGIPFTGLGTVEPRRLNEAT